jgi:hypothetical protein
VTAKTGVIVLGMETPPTLYDNGDYAFVPKDAPRIYGPHGFTREARLLLAPYLAPESVGGLTYFDQVPHDVALGVVRAVDRALMHAGLPRCVPQAALAAGCCPEATFAGYLVDENRPDERVEFREVHAPAISDTLDGSVG